MNIIFTNNKIKMMSRSQIEGNQREGKTWGRPKGREPLVSGGTLADASVEGILESI